jgi:hypothetical protein
VPGNWCSLRGRWRGWSSARPAKARRRARGDDPGRPTAILIRRAHDAHGVPLARALWGASGRLCGPTPRPAARATKIASAAVRLWVAGRRSGQAVVARGIGLFPLCRRRDRLIAPRGRCDWSGLQRARRPACVRLSQPSMVGCAKPATGIPSVSSRRDRRPWRVLRARTGRQPVNTAFHSGRPLNLDGAFFSANLRNL